MTILRLLHDTLALAFYARACREIDPLHPDVLHVELRRDYYASRVR